MFYLMCSEAFGFRDGREWMVGYYVFKKPLGIILFALVYLVGVSAVMVQAIMGIPLIAG